jgi:hypothetical protein
MSMTQAEKEAIRSLINELERKLYMARTKPKGSVSEEMIGTRNIQLAILRRIEKSK